MAVFIVTGIVLNQCTFLMMPFHANSGDERENGFKIIRHTQTYHELCSLAKSQDSYVNTSHIILQGMFIWWSQTGKALVFVESEVFYQKSNCFAPEEKGWLRQLCWAQLWNPRISRSKLCQEISSLASSCAPAVMKHEGLPQKTAATEPDSCSPVLVFSGQWGLLWKHQIAPSRDVFQTVPWPTFDLFRDFLLSVIFCRTYDLG